jgi:two-component system nitrogen regulation sensor histidine kinase NtrY
MLVQSLAARPPRPMDRFLRVLSVRLRRRTWMAAAERITMLTLLLVVAVSYLILVSGHPGQRLLAPSYVALILVLNLIPAIILLMLWGRRVALQRAARSPIGGTGRLHVRLVGIFSVVAAVPMLIMVIFASLLFQYGVEFWFSDHARAILLNAGNLAQGYYHERSQDVASETMTMAGDLRNDLAITTLNDPAFGRAYGQQVYLRKLSESAIIQLDQAGTPKTLAMVNPDARPVEKRITPDIIAKLKHGAPYVSQLSPDRIETVTLLYPNSGSYLYASRIADQQMLTQTSRAKAVLADYDLLLERSRRLQLYFNASLFLISLLIVGGAVFVALQVADRLVRPVGDMVGAARRVSAGDLSARVPGPLPRDEVGTLAHAFNTMTERLSEQTDALVGANALLERRRALTEAVLAGVSAGVIAVSRDHSIRILNQSARNLLQMGDDQLAGRPLVKLAPELDMMLTEGEHEGIKSIQTGGEERTLAVKIIADEGGHVLTFDDITTQINDQRRAAWADVARRIAHEIKNPLTPIQLAAERLQRRFAREISAEGQSTYTRLTETIVRQVGDLRRMVDEFSSFARIPKPVFRRENLVDIARQAIFLHEVAHSDIRFVLDVDAPLIDLVCDRRQLSQALINLLKNAVEAINEKPVRSKSERISVQIRRLEPTRIEISVADTGKGLPQDRGRLAEPYVTTRERGSGLGLAIVQKIVEDHGGTIVLSDNPTGGCLVTITLDRTALEARTDDYVTIRDL